jgi:tetrapyrrole methylase family protein/MazG family protein
MSVEDLIKLVYTLRKQCPWDREQTLQSMKNKVIEEAYELVEAIDNDDVPGIKEEIGDVLFLGFFMATLMEEEKHISLDDCISSTCNKYKEKHPHVFKDKTLETPDEVLQYWQRSKKDVFRGIAVSLPALLAAKTIQERAGKLGFDWESSDGPLDKVSEELNELASSSSKDERFEEFGDMLFACVNLARHLSIDPEDALRYANKKFVSRFRKVLAELTKEGKDIEHVSLEEMDRIWNKIKSDDG